MQIDFKTLNRAIAFIRPFLLALVAGPLMGQSGSTVANQTALNGILGSSAYTETFQGLALASGTAAVAPGFTSLDSTSILDFETIGVAGPGLVGPGVIYSAPNGGSVQFDAPGYYNAASEELLISGGTAITVAFSTPTDAFGVDVRDFQGFSTTMTVTIYGADNATVLNTFSGITLTDPAIFVGYQYSGGIGMVTFSDTESWSPILSKLTFSPVPEPPTATLIAGGLAVVLGFSVRRRFSVAGAGR